MSLELKRKLFHALALAYLAIFLRLGRDGALRVMAAWLLVVAAVELARLRLPALNARLLAALGSLRREREATRPSGVLWTSLGCWLTFWAVGRAPPAAQAGVLYLVFGDAAPALWAGALAATAAEMIPLPPDDNLWLPLASGLAVSLFL